MSENKKENLFAKLAMQNAMSAQHDAPPVDQQPAAPLPVAPQPAAPQPASPEPAKEPLPSPAPPVGKSKPSFQKPKARPTVGRRANPDYCQANAYVLKSVRRDVERALLDMDGLDYSELVEDLLTRWLKSRRVSG